MALADTLATIVPVDSAVAEQTQKTLDFKTKPRRSLGRLEDLACQVAAIRGEAKPSLLKKAIVVMGADHGVAQEGVSAYPQEVTGQMLLNFAGGGAAISVLARQAGAEVHVVDMGIVDALPAPQGIREHRIGDGTHNFAQGPAMSRAQAEEAITVGLKLAGELADKGVGIVGIGEMGIGNTTSASALTSVFTQTSVAEVTGRGTGIDDETFKRKIDVIERGIATNAPNPADALDVLSKLGGFEIAGLCGIVLGAAANRMAVVMDGFISSTAALTAVRLCPDVAGYLIGSHRSVEAGHRLVLEAIGQLPLLDLDMRLGEGTGAALAMQLVDASLNVLADMATFESAAVSDSGA